jgi:hypothetical protein
VIATDQIVSQLDSLLYRYRSAFSGETRELPFGRVQELLTSAQAAIERLAPPGTAYLSNCSSAVRGEYITEQNRLEWLMGIVEALRHDYAADALAPIQELIRAEVFDDFLEMAEHLMELGYKDPAAVLIGGVLEQHLRKLCLRANIDNESNGKPKKADTLNSELVAAKVYDKLDQKGVTSWLDLRNKAAHAEYSSYSSDQVKLQLLGVRDFIRRVHA